MHKLFALFVQRVYAAYAARTVCTACVLCALLNSVPCCMAMQQQQHCTEPGTSSSCQAETVEPPCPLTRLTDPAGSFNALAQQFANMPEFVDSLKSIKLQDFLDAGRVNMTNIALPPRIRELYKTELQLVGWLQTFFRSVSNTNGTKLNSALDSAGCLWGIIEQNFYKNTDEHVRPLAVIFDSLKLFDKKNIEDDCANGATIGEKMRELLGIHTSTKKSFFPPDKASEHTLTADTSPSFWIELACDQKITDSWIQYFGEQILPAPCSLGAILGQQNLPDNPGIMKIQKIITQAPQYLLIFLKQNPGAIPHQSKLSQAQVVIPLVLEALVSKNTNENSDDLTADLITYDLMGITLHHGKDRDLRYASLVKKASSWFFCEDENITAIAENEETQEKEQKKLFDHIARIKGYPYLCIFKKRPDDPTFPFPPTTMADQSLELSLEPTEAPSAPPPPHASVPTPDTRVPITVQPPALLTSLSATTFSTPDQNQTHVRVATQTDTPQISPSAPTTSSVPTIAPRVGRSSTPVTPETVRRQAHPETKKDPSACCCCWPLNKKQQSYGTQE